MDLSHDATSTTTSDTPSAFDLAFAADSSSAGGSLSDGSLGAEDGSGSGFQEGGAPEWSFDPGGPMLPRGVLFAEADRLSPEARAALNDYVRGAQRNHGQLYGSSASDFDGGLGSGSGGGSRPFVPIPLAGDFPHYAGEDLSFGSGRASSSETGGGSETGGDSEAGGGSDFGFDPVDSDGLYPGELTYEDHVGLDGLDAGDLYGGDLYGSGLYGDGLDEDGFDGYEPGVGDPDEYGLVGDDGSGFGPYDPSGYDPAAYESGEDDLSGDSEAQVAADRAWLRSRGLDPEVLTRLAEKEARVDEILAHHDEVRAVHHQEAWLRDHAEGALGSVAQETGGWNPGPEALREALRRGAQMPEHVRPATFTDLMIAADPRGYRAFLQARRPAGPDLGGESASAMAVSPLETGSGEVLAAARRALGLG